MGHTLMLKNEKSSSTLMLEKYNAITNMKPTKISERM